MKFIRFAQWKIDQAGEGVIGFITNHSYLDNPTFRGMRQSLMQTFDEIYLLDLHGNSLKKEKCPDGSKDENLFDIRQGVAIALFVKKKGLEKRVFHCERWGLREVKEEWLLANDVRSARWQEVQPKSEFYAFVPRDEKLLDRYKAYPRITDVFPVNSVGVVSSRDDFVIDFEKQALERRVRTFRDKSLPDEVIKHAFGLKDKEVWKLNQAREHVAKDAEWEKAIGKILYRPFDVRWIFYHDEVIERSRRKVLRHMAQPNLGLIARRQMLAEHIIDVHAATPNPSQL